MPIYKGTCPEHGAFERLVPEIGHPPVRINCPVPKCKRRVARQTKGTK